MPRDGLTVDEYRRLRERHASTVAAGDLSDRSGKPIATDVGPQKPREQERVLRPAPRTIYERRSACPYCGSIRLTSYGSRDMGDGCRLKYARCRECEAKFHIVQEPPNAA